MKRLSHIKTIIRGLLITVEALTADVLRLEMEHAARQTVMQSRGDQ
jgi:hypothetical protein